MQRVSALLLGALTRFRSESRFATLAVKDVPGARVRLDHVLRMTADAANRTLDLIEQSAPLAAATERRAAEVARVLDTLPPATVQRFLAEVGENCGQVRRNLAEVMLAQGFQDLTGQILCNVRTLVGEIESILQELACTAGVNLDLAEPGNGTNATPEGPAIPGITSTAVSNQDDVDDLIAGLGI
jgi:chemotaxis protein CheZ